MADDKQIETLTSTVDKLAKAQADSVKTFKEQAAENTAARRAAAQNIKDLRAMMDDASDENKSILDEYFKKSSFQLTQVRNEQGQFTGETDFEGEEGFTGTGGLEKVVENAIAQAQEIIGRQEEGVEMSDADKQQLEKLSALENAANAQLQYAEDAADETTMDAFRKYFGTMGDFKQFLGKLGGGAMDKAGEVGTKISDKVKDGFSFIFDIIKFGLVLFGGLTALTGFMDGWNNAFDWFGENATFGDMLASGLAGIVQAFTGITDDEAKGIAENAAYYINGVISILKRIVAAFGNITGLRDRQEGESILGDSALVIGSLLFMFGPKGMIGSAIGLLFKGFMALAGIVATAVGIPVAAVVAIVVGIGLIIAGIIYYWDEIKAGLSSMGEFLSDMYVKYIQPIVDTIKDFFVGLYNKAKEFFGGDTAELTQAIDEGLVESEGFIGFGNNKLNREMAEQASSEKLKMLLKDADLSRKDRRFVEDLLKSRDIQAAGQGGNVATADTMDETAAMKSEADAAKGGGDTAVIATTNNNQSSQTTNITPGGTDTQPGASYAIDPMPA